ncbi:MAG: hypothetical protein D6728_09905 [Cyanobacteria bacterium J055]|nr:MAG: hypothetical protein D6728_09905 [Cyanobacteria bacterium J055]
MREPSSLEPYERYRPQIKTGDVIAFSGNEGLSKLIRWATGSMFSHVGIVLNSNLSGELGGSVLIVESTVETRVRDATNSDVIKGVQLHWLSKRILMYDGGVWWVPLKQPLQPDGLAKMQSWLRQTNNQRVRYDYVQVMGAGLDMFEGLGISNRTSLSMLFCSELVTKALQTAGVVDSALNPSEQTPNDVVEFSCFDAGLPLKYA